MSYSFLDLVRMVDVIPYQEDITSSAYFKRNVYNFMSHDLSFQLGYLLPIVVEQLAKEPYVVTVNTSERIVSINPALNTLELRNEAFAKLALKWKSSELFETLKGWRDELYVIYSGVQTPYMRLERAMCPLMGVVMYGVHINGYVESNDSDVPLKIWVPRRSATKPTYPGKLDNTVAGGLGYPYGKFETCLKECYEEAGLDPSYTEKNLVYVGEISYLYQMKANDFETEAGLVQPELEYIYDLRMDADLIPHPVDNEAEDFKLMDVDEVIQRLKAGEFKHNCAGIIIEFLMRRGIISKEEPYFDEMRRKLHRVLPFPIQ
ncbi:hypothetical protein CANARDRAFT_5748 [[Candida] arabinofermentans NRRL YB-2248]|uniref:Nudix hydrolase domain-containing protein n=1 Tax=[Candida] arabinofermentans NRRL YB-2248 TaxID=983967 RepID=A0A1E4T637_9ASCO|nr:hypothetical protein CANARDRAFT_5748 [[Candida] arabinofermentans NRRL YB-2248]